MPLNDVSCRNLKAEEKPRKISDGGGLHLLVNPNGSKLWRLSYRYDGKQKTLALGAYPVVTLAEARNKRASAKELLRAQQDPQTKDLSGHALHSFEAVGREWFGNQSNSWVPAHASRIMARLERDIFPEFGARSIAEIEAPMILEAIRKVESRGALEISGRLLNTVGAIFRYAIATGKASRNPAADLKGALKKTPKVKHMAAIRETELPEFLGRLHNYDGDERTRLALEFVMHTFVRTSELRFATWDEFDGDVWRISAERMKMSREHIVPLTPQTLRILERLRVLSDGPYVAKMSQNTMIFAMYRLGYHSRATVHGFRSLASTVLNESGRWSPDAIERQLAHVSGDKVRSAYNSAQYMPERVKMMHWWSNYLISKAPSHV